MTTAYVATIGGHISELVELARRIPGGDDGVWITNENAQTRDLLDGQLVELVPFIAERDRTGVLRALPQARRLLAKHGVRRVISTGSAIALGYLPVGAAMGLECHYIESSTRVSSSSVTGRILSRTPRVRCWWQYDDAPPGFRHLGGVYDRFSTVEGPVGPEPKRFVVTVGTTDRDFRRLVTRLVDILPADAEVLWQTGHSDITDLDIDGHRLVPEAELSAAIAEADVVITHAGAGSLSLALDAGKVPVFVPRRAVHDEQVDDHQVELALWAAQQGLAVHAEADRLDRVHLETAARFRVATEPVGELVLA